LYLYQLQGAIDLDHEININDVVDKDDDDIRDFLRILVNKVLSSFYFKGKIQDVAIAQYTYYCSHKNFLRIFSFNCS